ncbi:glycoside hydrolase family 32 protein [Alloacidobacterium dinghuense]|uniref:beta-fructofuranosidase n=1 Tax=Alloacidobacterium dinghuense TaxID=2763107 RepID=A0A7G8BEP4_9BACT|nr:glycoside hydrolase family 32 protein [Alloacidobacterium dinghuense]QNI31014.1 glycoside hydrolase family 32 protein [Alloacidobacterium dinghuense]
MTGEISRRGFVQGCAGVAVASLLRGNALAAVDLAHDSNRPQFHLLPAANWMNDPNGPIFWKGKYHMFFQYNPHAAMWGDMHWAHSMSPDMVHWQHLPMALAPTKGGPDEEGCFSGSAVVLNGVPTFLYTGVKSVSANEATLSDGHHNFRETQCLATSSDADLRTWQKLPQPVLPSPPAGMKITGFRDPCLWQEDDAWYMGIGSGIRNQGGCVLLYRSADLRRWEYLHPLVSGEWNGKAAGDPVDSGEMWECPDFFRLGQKHVLLYSTERKVFWMAGEYDAMEHRFTSQQKGVLDYGPRAYYAPKTMLDKNGNRILWGWIPETRPEAEYSRAGWAGMMSLPRVLTLDANGQLEMKVLPRVQDLRSGDPVQPQSGEDRTVWPLLDLSAEAELWVQPLRGPVHLTIGTEATPAVHFHLDATHGTLTYNAQTVGTVLPQGQMRVSLYLDGSVLELFVNDKLAHTSRLYDLDREHTMLTITDPGSAVSDAFLWRIQPISSNRLTT